MAQQLRQRPGAPAVRKEPSKPRASHKWAVLSILLIACALLIFIALVTYDPADEANADVRFSHLWGAMGVDKEAQRLWDTTHNGLGLVGVLISDFLIRSTVGYSVFILPVLMVLWGWTMLRKGD
ncbi:MAG: DNA translocase FtsK 4TM domain-containing protein, partial [Bacteroidetes bacterium]|nr:DNA translocase FtsK 4TM domain-containing protein [Bacteroidota bacterium]